MLILGSPRRVRTRWRKDRMKNMWRADPLVWGHGPRVFEVFLEPTCPFSVNAFGKLDDPARPSGRGPHYRQAPPSVAALAHVLERDRALQGLARCNGGRIQILH